MNKILIVEDSRTISLRLKETIEKELRYDVVVSESYEACKKLLQESREYDIALLDLGLPDAPDGEVVELVSKFNIPIIVLSASEHPKEEIIHNNMIIDYIIKESSYAIEQSINMIRRFINNHNYTVLIVDDSKVIAHKMKSICHKYNFNTLTAYSAEEALQMFSKHDIKLVFVDYMLPGMNGLELTSKIRSHYYSDEVGIIAVSGSDDKSIISKFLKYGANDFLSKNSSVEEFVARVNNNIEMLELIQYNKDRANKDFLTGMYNRRYLFEKGKELFNKAHVDNKTLSMGIIDIDKFKNINDTYGHDIGDVAIKEISIVLHRVLDDNSLIARMGGEEFCVILPNLDEHRARLMFETIRRNIEQNIISISNIELRFTVSIGFTSVMEETFDEMLKKADLALYEAKETGRNRVVFHQA